MFKRLKNQKGFTLVELLVVVVILAVLAAMVIPQLKSSSTDAKLSALDTDLSAVRSSVELYYHQHDNIYPGKTAANTNHNGAAHGGASDAFIKQLTYCSDAAGNTTDTCNATYKYGPYLKKGVPKNPIPVSGLTDAQAQAVTVDTATGTLGTATADGSPLTGWKFVAETGEFFANNSAHASR